VQRYRESARALVSAFGQPGVLERVVTVPFGTVPGAVALHLRLAEALVHGWDLARARPRSTGSPPASAATSPAAVSGRGSRRPAGRKQPRR
jgi:uncharacterized protein (TIGR03086 family)